MASRKATSTADLQFIRYAIVDLQEIRWQRIMLERRVLKLRRAIVLRIIMAMHRRYRNAVRDHLQPVHFLVWLDVCKLHSETWLNHSFETRVYWATRPAYHAQRLEFNLDVEQDGMQESADGWYYELFEEILNEKWPLQGRHLKVTKERVLEPKGYSQPKFRLDYIRTARKKG